MINLDHEQPHHGNVSKAATWLLSEAKRLEISNPKIQPVTVKIDFNGSPMTAIHTDSVELILTRWHYERLLIQIANGVVNVRDYAERSYVR
jgi:hypothetical protein